MLMSRTKERQATDRSFAAALSFALISLATACATVDTRNQIVRDRATIDLDCPASKVNVEYKGKHLHLARGCGRRETYHVLCGSTTVASLCHAEK